MGEGQRPHCESWGPDRAVLCQVPGGGVCHPPCRGCLLPLCLLWPPPRPWFTNARCMAEHREAKCSLWVLTVCWREGGQGWLWRLSPLRPQILREEIKLRNSSKLLKSKSNCWTIRKGILPGVSPCSPPSSRQEREVLSRPVSEGFTRSSGAT